MEAVINCVVVKDDGCSNSDHLPVRCELLLDTGQSAPSVDGSTDGDMTQSTHMKQPTYVKPKWTDLTAPWQETGLGCGTAKCEHYANCENC